jgi:hypothetical protein
MNLKHLLKVLCVTELPPQLRNCIIPTPPTKLIAFLYKITHILSGRIYIGMHTWDGKVYWFSQKETKDLSILWGQEEDAFEYEILEYGTTEAMKEAEGLLLELVDATNHQMYFNENNGMRVKNKDLESDSLLVSELIKQINDKKWPAIKVTKEMIEDLQFKQCREEALNRDKLLEITERIQNKGGKTTICKPLIVLQDRNGSDLGVDGFHTFNGFMSAKNATQIDIIYIPKKYHKNIPDSFLNEIGNTFNKKDMFIKTEISSKDALKEMLGKHYSGYKLSDDYIREQCIAEYNFTPRQAGLIVSKFNTQKKIDVKNKKMNQTYITPSQSTKNKQKEKFKKLYPNKTVTIQSSDTYGLDRALKPAKAENSRDILVIVHHKNSILEEEWIKTKHQEWIDLQEYTKSDIKIQYESLTGWSNDILSK